VLSAVEDCAFVMPAASATLVTKSPLFIFFGF